jgi:hypothetical protein
MTTYEAYETVRDHLIPGGWDHAGTGERYPGEYHARSLVAVQELWEYVQRTADFWALEPEPDMSAVWGHYNSLWDTLTYQPGEHATGIPTEPNPEPEQEPAAEFFEEDQPTEEILAIWESGEKGVTGAPTAGEDAGLSAQATEESAPEYPDSERSASPRLDDGSSDETAVLPAAESPNNPAIPGPLAFEEDR